MGPPAPPAAGPAALRAPRLPHLPPGRPPARLQDREQRIEVRAHRLGHELAEALEIEHVDVGVAGVAGHLLEPAELAPEVPQRFGWEGALELTLNRAAAPDRD